MTDTTDPQTVRPEVDDPRVLALAKARQHIAHSSPFNFVCPPWDGLASDEQQLSLLDARNYLHAALDAGLVPASAPSAPADRAGLRERIAEALWPLTDWDGDQLNAEAAADAVLSVLPPAVDRPAVLRGEAARIRAHCPDHLDSESAEGSWMACHCAVADDMERRATDWERDDQQGASLIDDYLRFLRGQGPEPDLTELAPADREVIAGRFEIVRALADRDPELPPLDRDPVARRLGLLADCPGRVAGEEQQAETQAEEVALLRLTVGAVEEGRRELRSENARLRAQLWTLAAALDGLHTLIATSSRDWGTYRVDAWLWAVLVGWDCEEAHKHDELCEDGAAMAELRERHGWDAETVAKARRYRAAVRALTDTAAAPVAGQPPADTGEEARTVCVCSHTKGEHITVSGRLLCDSCDPNSTDNLVCKGFDAL